MTKHLYDIGDEIVFAWFDDELTGVITKRVKGSEYVNVRTSRGTHSVRRHSILRKVEQ